ncbi:MAG: hypothetical protein H7Y32_02430 [Chloroflexales bacterium]|nr:hypothetical protein [Chloroflexales bacterium]
MSDTFFVLRVLLFAAAHLVTSLVLAFAAGISPSGPLRVVAAIMTFPFSVLPGALDDLVPPLVFWLLYGLLSLAWGLAIATLLRLLVRR